MNRVGIGIDVHRFAAGRKCIIGGVEIPHTHGLEGHSDADVLVLIRFPLPSFASPAPS